MTEHGHQTLINYILKEKDENLKGKTIIEIGSCREFLEGQNSTECFIKLCMEKDMKFISVDMDEKCSQNVYSLAHKYKSFTNMEIHTCKGEDYLKTIDSFDFMYLDGYDYEHGQHSEDRQERYNHYMGKDINNEECWESHLLMVKELCKIAHKDSVICFDDIIDEKVGKGVTAIPYILDKKWQVFKRVNNSVLFVHPDRVLLPREVYVVGNGRSLKGFDFNFLKDKEWIGCCLGFRDWERTGIYPTHYVNVDPVVTQSNLKEIKDMIINKKCQTFCLDYSFIKMWPECKDYPSVHYLQQYQHTPYNPFRNLIDYCSGSVATTLAYCLDTDRVNLLGMDCKYVEFLPECIELKDKTLKIIKQPTENPNYYFDDYQRVGDIYNKPNVDRVMKQSWFDLRNIFLLFNTLRNKEVKLYNYNTTDVLDEYFERKSLDEFK
tara:strand:- start:663 stop:1967 length:1305 start_codon:yes stop_codon:yes gene_type:complete